MVIDDMQQDNSEMKTVYPPRVLREWLECNSISGFYENLKKKVWGQDEELKKAAIMIYGFITAMANNAFDRKFHFMIEGASGCGKSTFAYRLQELLPIPVLVLDSSTITPSGYKGTNIAEILASEELEKFWGCGILVADELDKLMQPTHSSEGNFHQEALHNFLKLMDGGVLTLKDGTVFPCNKLLVIGMGAFSPLRQPQTVPVRRNIGFCAERLSEAAQAPQRPVEQNITKEQMTAFCGSNQFLGRFLTVLHFKKLGKEAFHKIVWQTEAEIREVYGCGFGLPMEERLMLIEKAMTADFGARGIKSAVWEAFLSNPDEWGIMTRQAANPQMDFDAFFGENMERIMSA